VARHATVNGNIPFDVQVAMGVIPGWSTVILVGHDEAAAQGNGILSPGNAAASVIIDPTGILNTATTIFIASTDDTKDIAAGVGANAVKVSGCDAAGNEQTEVITLHASSGNTRVESSLTYSAVNDLLVVATGSENDNSGLIWCGTGTFTAGVPAVGIASIAIGENHSLTGVYTVPLNHEFYIQAAEMSGDGSAAFKGLDFEVHLVSAALGHHFELFDAHLGDGGSLTVAPPFPKFVGNQQLQLLGGSIAQTANITMRVTGFLRNLAQPHSWGP
jgi:hypothetical protein